MPCMGRCWMRCLRCSCHARLCCLLHAISPPLLCLADRPQNGYWSVPLPWATVLVLNSYVRGSCVATCLGERVSQSQSLKACKAALPRAALRRLPFSHPAPPASPTPCLQLPYGPTSRQYRWAAQRLAAVNRTATPWLLVLMHGAPRTTFVPSFQAS